MALAAHLDTLAPVREKILAGERLDFDDGVTLLESEDLLALGELADTARRLRGGGDEVYFINNLYLNHTNVCRVKCKFCAFARTGRQEGAYTWDIADLVAHAVEVHGRESYDEIHMVGGEHPHIGYDYYPDVTRALHEALPDVHLKLFTASEIHHMTKLSGKTHAEVLADLKAAGLGSLPGGGAEVFADRVRRLVRRARSIPTTGSPPIARPTGWGSRPTAPCSTGMSRPTRSGSTTGCGCATCRTRRAGSWRSSRCRSTPRTRSSSAAAGASRPATTISR